MKRISLLSSLGLLVAILSLAPTSLLANGLPQGQGELSWEDWKLFNFNPGDDAKTDSNMDGVNQLRAYTLFQIEDQNLSGLNKQELLIIDGNVNYSFNWNVQAVDACFEILVSQDLKDWTLSTNGVIFAEKNPNYDDLYTLTYFVEKAERVDVNGTTPPQSYYSLTYFIKEAGQDCPCDYEVIEL